MARKYESYGYRQITGLLAAGEWSVNHKRVERVWRREGLFREINDKSWLLDGC
ncbi:transposase [Rhodobacteraceae bacterium]|nr:transposase [Paracoccaceae bacterium]